MTLTAERQYSCIWFGEDVRGPMSCSDDMARSHPVRDYSDGLSRLVDVATHHFVDRFRLQLMLLLQSLEKCLCDWQCGIRR